MAHLIISNKQPSIIDLTPVKDTEGRMIVLRPAGTPGDSREISSDEAAHDIVSRVKTAGWVDVKLPVPAVVEPPAKIIAAVAVKPAPAPVEPPPPAKAEVAPVEPPPPVKAEVAPVVSAEEPVVVKVEAPADIVPVPAPTPAPAPTKSRK